jgi:hypothetical protein
MDGSDKHVSAAKALLGKYPVTILQAFVTLENIVNLLSTTKVPKELDLLVIDIDGNDYHIWNCVLEHFSPRVVVIEFNSSLGPMANWTVVYDPEFRWNNTAYFGASLKALEQLGANHNYSLVGCDSAGVNAFFVRNDLAKYELFPYPTTSTFHYSSPRYGTTGNYGHSII